MMNRKFSGKHATIFILLLTTCFFINGCTTMGTGDSSSEDSHTQSNNDTTVTFEPYYPADFRDLLIPGELEWNRDKSFTITTDSFNGGILNFNGRVEVTSLMEFFVTGMKNDGWTTVGSIKSKNVLLAFTKDSSTCMIQITEGGPIGKTDVQIYISTQNNK